MPRLWLTKILAGIQSSAELVDLSDAGVAPPNYKKGSILWRWREEWKQSIIRTVVKSDVTLFHWTDWGSHHHYGLTKPAMSCLSKTGPVSCGCLVIWMLVWTWVALVPQSDWARPVTVTVCSTLVFSLPPSLLPLLTNTSSRDHWRLSPAVFPPVRTTQLGQLFSLLADEWWDWDWSDCKHNCCRIYPP